VRPVRSLGRFAIEKVRQLGSGLLERRCCVLKRGTRGGRRYRTHLAPEMQALNYRLVQTLVPSCLQSVEEIEAIVHQATRPVHWPDWPKAKPV